MKISKWFDREFDFRTETPDFPVILARLKDTARSLKQLAGSLPDSVAETKPGGKWSMKEHIGHLCVLEPLWQARFGEISAGKEIMSPADLDNKATDAGGFNDSSMAELLDAFSRIRQKTLEQLTRFPPGAFAGSSLHPRLRQPMRIADMAYFVAEHDDHHRKAITEIIKSNQFL